MLGFETGEQCLVDGPDDVVGQDRALAAQEPLMDDRRSFTLRAGTFVVDGHGGVPRHELLVLLVESSFRVSQGNA